MNTRSVEILGTVITASHGSLSTGDKLINISAEFAAHLVNDCNAAKYIDQAPEIAAESTEKPEADSKKSSKKIKNDPVDDPETPAESSDDLTDETATDGESPSE